MVEFNIWLKKKKNQVTSEADIIHLQVFFFSWAGLLTLVSMAVFWMMKIASLITDMSGFSAMKTMVTNINESNT